VIKQRVLHAVDGMAEVAVRPHAYPTANGSLPVDIYGHLGGDGRGAVVLVTGLPDPGAQKMLGAPLRAWASYVGWARMIAARGMTAILYENRAPGDVAALFQWLRERAPTLGIDPARLGVWACSGHGPNALATIARERPACAALLYSYLMDLDGATEVADAATSYYFATPPVAIDDLAGVPMLIVRAASDATPGLDASMQRFVAAARAKGFPIETIEHPGPHAFDLVDDSPATHDAIERVLAYLASRLT
jgi:hypothetical protein